MSESTFSAWLKLARLSNIPTVFSNVLVGFAVVAPPADFPWPWTLFAIGATSFLYVGGMALNDLLDRDIDAVERPQRPIPSGALSPRAVTIFTTLCFAFPLAAIALLVPVALLPALALVAAIVLYDLLHKRWSGSLIFMGLCRAFVYALAAAIASHSAGQSPTPDTLGTLGVFAAVLALYIIGLTVVAQKEVEGGLGFRRWLAVALAFLPFLVLFAIRPEHPIWTLATGLLLLVWLVRSARFIRREPPKVVPAVLGWLAGISLLDAYFLTFTARPELALVAVACFAATVTGHRRIPGT